MDFTLNTGQNRRSEAVSPVQRPGVSPSIGEALLDQRRMAGIGNVYRAEVLFLSGLWPFLPLDQVPDLLKVVNLSRRLLVENKDRTLRVTTGVNRPGQNLWVYGRLAGPAEVRHRDPVSRDRPGGSGADRLLVPLLPAIAVASQ